MNAALRPRRFSHRRRWAECRSKLRAYKRPILADAQPLLESRVLRVHGYKVCFLLCRPEMAEIIAPFAALSNFLQVVHFSAHLGSIARELIKRGDNALPEHLELSNLAQPLNINATKVEEQYAAQAAEREERRLAQAQAGILEEEQEEQIQRWIGQTMPARSTRAVVGARCTQAVERGSRPRTCNGRNEEDPQHHEPAQGA